MSFPLKMPDCCRNLLFLPCGCSSPVGGWFSGWSRQISTYHVGHCACAVQKCPLHCQLLSLVFGVFACFVRYLNTFLMQQSNTHFGVNTSRICPFPKYRLARAFPLCSALHSGLEGCDSSFLLSQGTGFKNADRLSTQKGSL